MRRARDAVQQVLQNIGDTCQTWSLWEAPILHGLIWEYEWGVSTWLGSLTILQFDKLNQLDEISCCSLTSCSQFSPMFYQPCQGIDIRATCWSLAGGRCALHNISTEILAALVPARCGQIISCHHDSLAYCILLLLCGPGATFFATWGHIGPKWLALTTSQSQNMWWCRCLKTCSLPGAATSGGTIACKPDFAPPNSAISSGALALVTGLWDACGVTSTYFHAQQGLALQKSAWAAQKTGASMAHGWCNCQGRRSPERRTSRCGCCWRTNHHIFVNARTVTESANSSRFGIVQLPSFHQLASWNWPNLWAGELRWHKQQLPTLVDANANEAVPSLGSMMKCDDRTWSDCEKPEVWPTPKNKQTCCLVSSSLTLLVWESANKIRFWYWGCLYLMNSASGNST